jgi:hypothetical protein
MATKYAGCENDDNPEVDGKNVHDALVTFEAVNSGKKKVVAGGMGTQSKLMLLPVKDTLGEENACMIGDTSKTDTATSLKVITMSVIDG